MSFCLPLTHLSFSFRLYATVSKTPLCPRHDEYVYARTWLPSANADQITQAKKQVSYKESDSEGEDDDDVIFRPSRKNGGRAAKRRKTSPESEDEFQANGEDAGYSEDGMFCSPLVRRMYC